MQKYTGLSLFDFFDVNEPDPNEDIAEEHQKSHAEMFVTNYSDKNSYDKIKLDNFSIEEISEVIVEADKACRLDLILSIISKAAEEGAFSKELLMVAAKHNYNEYVDFIISEGVITNNDSFQISIEAKKSNNYYVLESLLKNGYKISDPIHVKLDAEMYPILFVVSKNNSVNIKACVKELVIKKEYGGENSKKHAQEDLDSLMRIPEIALDVREYMILNENDHDVYGGLIFGNQKMKENDTGDALFDNNVSCDNEDFQLLTI